MEGSCETTKVVPLKKQSKSAQRAYHASRRGSWGALSPVTRVSPDRKKYDRKRLKREALREERGRI